MFNLKTMNFEFDTTKQYLELGGGAAPIIRPNADVRECFDKEGRPTVDAIINLELPFTADHNQPLQDGQFDGIFSKFAFEHVSWRVLPQLLKECCRIVKPGSPIVLVLPNTKAQMEHLLKSQDWDDGGSMLFGGQDYGENAHKAFISPEKIEKQLAEAGFTEGFEWVPFGEKKTDMILKVFKGNKSILRHEASVVNDLQGYLERRKLGNAPPPPKQPTPEEVDRDWARRLMEEVEHEKEKPIRVLGEQMVQVYGQTHSEAASMTDLGLNQGVVVNRDDLSDDELKEMKRQVLNRRPAPEKLRALTPAKVQAPPGLTVPDAEQRKALLAGLPITTSKEVSATRQGIQRAEGEEATKLRLEQLEHFDRRYFDGGGPWGGFDAYWDFPCHELTAQKILALRPESVLELGAARGYVLKRLEAAGVNAEGWDVSQHCYLTRVSDGVRPVDVTDPEVWSRAADNARCAPFVDLCYSVSFFDHLPEGLIPYVLEGMAKYTKRGVHGVNFGPQEGDKTRLTCKPKEWWQAIMPKGHRIVNKDEMESGTYQESYLKGDGKVKLNLGSFTTMFHHGWQNIDIVNVGQFAMQSGYQFTHWDVRQGLPYGTESVDCIYSSHMIEHLTAADGLAFLKECRRVLKPDGVLRVLMPDAGKLIGMYSAAQSPLKMENPPLSLSMFDQLSKTCGEARTEAGKLYELLVAHHSALYDAETLVGALQEAGFRGYQHVGEGSARADDDHTDENYRQLLGETFNPLPDISLVADCVGSVDLR